MQDTPVLALDVDGVILDYVTGIAGYAASLGHAVGCEPHDVAEWGLETLLPTLTVAQRKALYAEFSTHETFSALAAYEGALAAVTGLRERFPWLRIVAITSAGRHADTTRLRQANLLDFALDEIHVLGMEESKRDHLARLPEGSVFVDDLMVHVAAAESVGVDAILFRRSYNTADEHHRTVHDWTELAAHVTVLLDRRVVYTADWRYAGMPNRS